MKEIIVQKNCVINSEDLAPSKAYSRDTAVCITQKTEDEKGFINYMLAIESYQSCCESLGSGLIFLKEVDQSDVYVSRITHDAGETRKYMDLLEMDYCEINRSIITEIYGENDELIALAYVFNDHDGYYAHEVYSYNNNNIEVAYL